MSFQVRTSVALGFTLSCVGKTIEAKSAYEEAKNSANCLLASNALRGFQCYVILFIHSALPLYYLAQYDFLYNFEHDQAIATCNEACNTLEAADLDTISLPLKFLKPRIYNCLMQSYLAKDLWQEAEELGKKSLDITNSLCDRDDPLVEWTLHLLCQAMVGEKKYFFAEGLLRRLDSLLVTKEEKEGGQFSLFEIQHETLRLYAKVMENFNRQTELSLLRSRMERYTAGKDCLPNILMHAQFEPFVWNQE